VAVLSANSGWKKLFGFVYSLITKINKTNPDKDK